MDMEDRVHSLGCGVSMYLSERCLFLLSDSGRGSPLSRREMIRLYSRGLGWHALSADQLVAVLVCVHRRVCSAVAQAPQHTCKTFMNLRQQWAKKLRVRLSVQSAAGPHLFFKGCRPSCPTCACTYICRLRGNSTGACVLISVATAPQVGHIHIYICM